MILGEFGAAGCPFLEGSLSLPRFGVTRHINFLVDTGADATCIHPRDGQAAGIPFDLLQGGTTSRGVGGQATYFREPAVLEFVDAEARKIHSFETTVNVAKPGTRASDPINTIYSLLGRDIIDRWHMVYDRTAGRLEFTVKETDFAL
ncbi:MAG: aspartyl protease family protein [Chloroflexi bacterium]|nr:aspartyl protease family protein [Chloroflexota bacterium]